MIRNFGYIIGTLKQATRQNQGQTIRLLINFVVFHGQREIAGPLYFPCNLQQNCCNLNICSSAVLCGSRLVQLFHFILPKIHSTISFALQFEVAVVFILHKTGVLYTTKLVDVCLVLYERSHFLHNLKQRCCTFDFVCFGILINTEGCYNLFIYLRTYVL